MNTHSRLFGLLPGMVAAALLIALSASSCGGNAAVSAPQLQGAAAAAQPQQPSGGSPDLPAPSSLLRGVSFTDNDRFRLGLGFDSAMLPQNAVANGLAMTYSPSYDGSSIDGMAYAVYGFSLAGFADAQALTHWVTAPPAGALWLALANYPADRWDWFAAQPGTVLNLGSMTPYVDGGTGVVLLVVMVGGSDPAELDWLRLGGNLAPQANLQGTPLSGAAPLSVDFDASLSSDLDGSIAKYEWDWDGNGSFDFDSGTDSTVNHGYNAGGSYDAAVRVTDDTGATATAQVTVDVTGGMNQAPTAVIGSDYFFTDAPLDASLDGTASSDPDGTITTYEWDWQSDGTYDATGATPTHSFAAGTYTVTLRVTDNGGAQDTATAQFTADTAGYDEVENNDTKDAPNSLPGLQLSGWEGNLGDDGYDGDLEDWYSFTVAGARLVTLKMDFLDAEADLDMKLYAANGTTELGSSTGTADGETISKFLDPGTYLWKCYRYGTEVSKADYTLSATEEVVELPVAVISGNPLSGNIPLTVDFDGTASYDPGGGSITKWEWDLDGNGTYESSSTTDGTITGMYYRSGSFDATLRVTNTGGASDTEKVTVTVAPGGLFETENNDETATANSLPGFPFDDRLCDLGIGGYDGDEADWYKLTLASDGTVDLTMKLYDPVGDLDMKLYQSDGTTEAGTSTGTDNDENINKLLTAGTYYLKCYVYNSVGGNTGGGYTLSGSFTP
jgi:large repetitive protein